MLSQHCAAASGTAACSSPAAPVLAAAPNIMLGLAPALPAAADDAAPKANSPPPPAGVLPAAASEPAAAALLAAPKPKAGLLAAAAVSAAAALLPPPKEKGEVPLAGVLPAPVLLPKPKGLAAAGVPPKASGAAVVVAAAAVLAPPKPPKAKVEAGAAAADGSLAGGRRGGCRDVSSRQAGRCIPSYMTAMLLQVRHTARSIVACGGVQLRLPLPALHVHAMLQRMAMADADGRSGDTWQPVLTISLYNVAVLLQDLLHVLYVVLGAIDPYLREVLRFLILDPPALARRAQI